MSALEPASLLPGALAPLTQPFPNREQAYGFILLFADFFPTAIMFMKNVPFVGPALNHPRVKAVLNKVAPNQTLPV